MQTLWANLLAGEANKPGAFSKRTVNFVANMSKRDALLLTDFCQFAWNINSDTNDLDCLIFNIDDEIYKTSGVHAGLLHHLEAIGLLSIASQNIVFHMKREKLMTTYFDNSIIITPTSDDNKFIIPIGKINLSQISQELFPICGAKKNDAFFDYVINKWEQEKGFELTILDK